MPKDGSKYKKALDKASGIAQPTSDHPAEWERWEIADRAGRPDVWAGLEPGARPVPDTDDPEAWSRWEANEERVHAAPAPSPARAALARASRGPSPEEMAAWRAGGPPPPGEALRLWERRQADAMASHAPRLPQRSKWVERDIAAAAQRAASRKSDIYGPNRSPREQAVAGALSPSEETMLAELLRRKQGMR